MKHAPALVGLPVTGKAISSAGQEPRWQIVNLVVSLREALGLTSSDIALLRGLVFLIPQQSWGLQMVVYASNRVLAARSDGLNERTLRRALQRLIARGFIQRRDSSNRKRYKLSLEAEGTALCFGIDLSPLLALEADLTRRAEEMAREAKRCKALKSLVRHNLYLIETQGRVAEGFDLAACKAALRRKLDSAALQELLDSLSQFVPLAPKMSVNDSQSVRHSQKSNTEYKDESRTEESITKNPITARDQDLSLEDCLKAAPLAVEFASERPGSWGEVIALSERLAPGIGIGRDLLDKARTTLGAHGFALAILGLVQSFERISAPASYLSRLVRQCREGRLNPVRMFRSLTRTRSMSAAQCLPG